MPSGWNVVPTSKNSFTISGMATSRPNVVTNRVIGGAVRRYRNSIRSSAIAEYGREHERDQHRDRDREVVTGPRLVVDRAGRERLRTEGQVEDARGLVRQHQTDGEQRVDAAEGETSEDGAQDLVQRVALPGSCWLPRTFD